MQRRHFIQTLSAAGLGALAAPRNLFAATRLERIGLELYSVRAAMKADPERTLAAVRAIGYTDVELLWSFGNFGRTDDQVRETLANEGLRAPSAHIAPQTLIRDDWEQSVAAAKRLGHQYLIVPSLPAESRNGLDVWKYWADIFNVAGAVSHREGVWLAFHNEPDHMKPMEGRVPYDLFLERLDPKVVRLQLDVGNMLLGGADPLPYLKRYPDRYWSFHLKDVVADRSHDTELGKGTFDFKGFLGAIKSLSEKPCYVEQEGAKDDLASARLDFQYLKMLGF